jgi:hypothetical protein
VLTNRDQSSARGSIEIAHEIARIVRQSEASVEPRPEG